jgi:hypothetical protein
LGYTGPGGVVTVPDSVAGLPAVSIEGSVFSGCTGLTSITIPDSVASLGAEAFSGCISLIAAYFGACPQSGTFLSSAVAWVG